MGPMGSLPAQRMTTEEVIKTWGMRRRAYLYLEDRGT